MFALLVVFPATASLPCLVVKVEGYLNMNNPLKHIIRFIHSANSMFHQYSRIEYLDSAVKHSVNICDPGAQNQS